MTISEILLPEFDKETAGTRKILASVPEDKFTWQPHDKSMTLVRLASHVAELPHWAVETMARETLEITPGQKPFIAGSKEELMAAFEKHASEARAAIAAGTDEQMTVPWSLIFGGHKAFTMPRFMVLRTVVMNHLIHHRAQLGVYLRLNEIAVPGMYGPSADDKASFGAAG
jgi:uncharacterized damage-inducible protein DinB